MWDKKNKIHENCKRNYAYTAQSPGFSFTSKMVRNVKNLGETPFPQEDHSVSAGSDSLELNCVSPLALAAQAYALKEENDSLRWQLDAYRNEVELLKQEKEQLFRTEENLTKDQQLQFLQQTMQGMQQVWARVCWGFV